MSRASVYTIPPHRSFADALAAGLMAREGRDRMTLARGLVLVPNNRAARAIQDAFVRRADGGLLLPRLVPIGDPAALARAIERILDNLESWREAAAAAACVVRATYSQDAVCAQLERVYQEMIA